MGLFSSKTIVKVASTAYNLAGEEKDRPQYLKSMIVRNVLSGTKDSIATTLNKGYLNGPGIKLRSFYRWAQKNFTIIGMPEGRIGSTKNISVELIKPHIVPAPGYTVWVQDADYDVADYSFWVEQWIFANRPDQADTDYYADIGEDDYTITINFVDGSSQSFVAANFDPASRYIYAYYNEVSNSEIIGTERFGPIVDIGYGFPDMSGWVPDPSYSPPADHETQIPVELVNSRRETVTYSDNRPPVNNYTEDRQIQSWTKRYQAFFQETITPPPAGSDTINALRKRRVVTEGRRVETTERVQTTTYDAGNGVTATQTFVFRDQQLTGANTVQEIEQDVVKREWSHLKVWIYRIGSGIPSLDAAVTQSGDPDQFFPFLPMRHKNNQIDAENLQDVYAQCKKAWKKAAGSKWDKISDKLLDNDSIDDIDNAYVVFGVSLNVLEQSCRRYLWDFFQRLMTNQEGGKSAYDAYKTQENLYKADFQQWEQWRNQGISQGQNQPNLGNRPVLGDNHFSITSRKLDLQYDVQISWNFITEGTMTGLGKPGAKVGEIWLTPTTTDVFEVNIYRPAKDEVEQPPEATTKNIQTIRIFRQVSATRCDYMDVVGLLHTNYVYNGKSEKITGVQALTAEEESPFIMPLHYGTFRSMPLRHSTQMSTACVFLVLNSYEIVKQKWYERGIFKIIFVIVLAIVSVVLTGGAGFGVLGAHMAVGSALGLSGMTAAIVGSVANALAGLVISTLLEKGLVSMFGEAIGGLLAGVLTAFAAGGVIGFDISQGLSFNWGNIMRADVLIGLTDAVGRGITGFVMQDIQSMMKSTMDFLENVEDRIGEINSKYIQDFGYGRAEIDPLMLVNGTNGVRIESSDTFLSRTLMTGGDIANMTNDMVSNFSDYTKALPEPFA